MRDLHTRTKIGTTLSLSQGTFHTPSLPAWAGAAQEPNLVSSPLGKNSPGKHLCPGLLAVEIEWPS